MKMAAAKITVLIVALVSSGSIGGIAANSWNIGQMVSSSVSGQGSNTQEKDKAASRQDIWWNYCIASQGTAYSVASRLTPAKSGLSPDNPIKFRISRNQMQILRPSGKRIELRILRKDAGNTCQ